MIINLSLIVSPIYLTSLAPNNPLTQSIQSLVIESKNFPSKEQLSKLPSSLRTILDIQSKAKILALLQKKEIKEQIYEYVCESDENFKTAFFILNKTINDIQLVNNFFETLNLKEDKKLIHCFFDYKKYLDSCESSCESLYFSIPLYSRLNALFKAFFLPPPPFIRYLKQTSYCVSIQELQMMMNQIQKSLLEVSILEAFLYQDLLKIIEKTIPFIQLDMVYLEKHQASDEFFKELNEVKKNDILETVVGRGSSGTVYHTTKKHVVAKITKKKMQEESKFLNTLYGYEFSRVDNKTPHIMYMRHICSNTLEKVNSKPDIKEQQKVLILERVLDQIHKMHAKRLIHQDLKGRNILIQQVDTKPIAYLIDPNSDTKTLSYNDEEWEEELIDSTDQDDQINFKVDYYSYRKKIEQQLSLRETRKVLSEKKHILDRWYKNCQFEEMSLHRACFRGKTEKIKRLLYSGANPNITDKYGMTPLMIAVMHPHLENIMLLLNYGANINFTSIVRAESSLIIAVKHRKNETVKYLLDKGANPNQCDWTQKTPLMQASSEGDDAIVESLIKNKKTDILYQNKKGETALSLAKASQKDIYNQSKDLQKRFDRILQMLEKPDSVRGLQVIEENMHLNSSLTLCLDKYRTLVFSA